MALQVPEAGVPCALGIFVVTCLELKLFLFAFFVGIWFPDIWWVLICNPRWNMVVSSIMPGLLTRLSLAITDEEVK